MMIGAIKEEDGFETGGGATLLGSSDLSSHAAVLDFGLAGDLQGLRGQQSSPTSHLKTILFLDGSNHHLTDRKRHV